MISVIVCSVNKRGRAAFASEVARTIGTVYELIMIENEVEQLSICAAYNKGAALAQYPFLCFVHEDVSFHSPRWGEGLIQPLTEKGTGLLGLAGATIKTRNPSPWWITHEDPLARRYQRTHFIQSGAAQSVPAETASFLEEVLCLDGFFLACSKVLWMATRFDEVALTGFHFYDMDICFSARQQGAKNYVYTGCSIEHHSLGSLNAGWITGAESFQKKWQSLLPAFTTAIAADDLSELERLALIDYIHVLITNGYTRLALKYLFRLLIKYKNTFAGNQLVKRYIKSLLHG